MARAVSRGGVGRRRRVLGAEGADDLGDGAAQAGHLAQLAVAVSGGGVGFLLREGQPRRRAAAAQELILVLPPAPPPRRRRRARSS